MLDCIGRYKDKFLGGAKAKTQISVVSLWLRASAGNDGRRQVARPFAAGEGEISNPL